MKGWKSYHSTDHSRARSRPERRGASSMASRQKSVRSSAVTPAKKVSKYSIRSSTSSASRSPGGVGSRLGAQLGQALADGAAVGPLEGRLLVVEVEQEGVAQDLDDVGLGQQPHAHREVLVAGAQAKAEARHQAGRLAIARRIDLAQEVVGLVGEARLQRTAVAARQDRDQVGFAGLARTEHADAHAAAGGARQLAALVADLLQLADQRRRLLRHGGRLRRPRPSASPRPRWRRRPAFRNPGPV